MRAVCLLLLTVLAVVWGQVVFDLDVMETTTPVYDCVGKKDGLYPDPDDCHCFFECSNERSLFFRCPNGTAFSDTAKLCEFESMVPGCGGP